jgi:cytochrome c553
MSGSASEKIIPNGGEVSVKSSVFVVSAAAVLLAVAAIAAATAAQSPAIRPSNGSVPLSEPRVYSVPINLKVLPKNLTGQQVHEIMEQWAAALGTHCNSCHVEDRSQIGPNGRPRLDFVDDSKEMKITARTMYSMTEKINTDYVAKIDSSGAAVTCGTCHRGHLGPEPFAAAPKNPPSPSPNSQSNGKKLPAQ